MVKLANISGGCMQVNIFEAKTDLSKLIKKIETKEESSITIARHGKPVAVLIPFSQNPASLRIGAGVGKAFFPDNIDIDEDNELIEELFYGEQKK